MRKSLVMLVAVAVVAAPLMFGPTEASASCAGRKNTGTVLGGIGGALIGSSVSNGGTGGTILGGLGGAVVGHQIAKSGCGRAYSRSYRAPRRTATAAAPAPARRIYYDQYGNPVGQVQTVSR